MTRMRSGGANAALAVLLMLILGVAAPVAAQSDTEPRMWTAISVRGRVGGDSPWQWGADSLVRTRNGTGTIDFLAEWVSVSRDLTPRSSIGIGYAYGAGFPDAGPLREQRFVQQYTWSTGRAWKVSFRSRVEERFITGHGAVLVRTRQQVRATWPLATRGALRGVASEEILVKVNSTRRVARGFDSNRVFLGVARPVTARSRVELGYVNVYSPGASSRTRRSHIMSATLVVSM